jgi:hypothetical protein
LSRDVLFRIVTPEKSQLNVQRIDDNLWKPLDQAISILSDKLSAVSSQLSAISTNAIFDQLIRLRALRCWFMTQRNVAAWIAGVYGYMDDTGEDAKKRWHKYLKDAIQKEIANSHEVLELLDAGIEFMTLTDQGESPLVYGTNLRELIPKRIQLMEEHIDDEPYIDHNYIERRAADASV